MRATWTSSSSTRRTSASAPEPAQIRPANVSAPGPLSSSSATARPQRTRSRAIAEPSTSGPSPSVEVGVGGPDPQPFDQLLGAAETGAHAGLVPDRESNALDRVVTLDPQRAADVLAVHEHLDQPAGQRGRRRRGQGARRTEGGEGLGGFRAPLGPHPALVVAVEVEPGSGEPAQEPPPGLLGGLELMGENVMDVPVIAQGGRRPLLRSQVVQVGGEGTALGVHGGPDVVRRHAGVDRPRRWNSSPLAELTRK